MILMPAAVLTALLWAPKAEILGDTSRILYFHVPSAIVSVTAFIVSGIYSIRFLAGGAFASDMLYLKARNSAGLGMLFTILTIATGSVWAKAAWGSFWNWDPRETSIAVFMLIYIAYFSLYSSLGESPSKGKISSVYLVMAMFVMPFFVFVIPRVHQSLHPDTIINSEGVVKLERDMRIALLLSAAAFIFLYCHLMHLKNRLIAVEKKFEGEEEESL